VVLADTRRHPVRPLVFISLLVCTDHAGVAGAERILADGCTTCAAEFSHQEKVIGDHTALLQTRLTVRHSPVQVRQRVDRSRNLDALHWLSEAVESRLRPCQISLDSFMAKIAPIVLRWKTHHMLTIERNERERNLHPEPKDFMLESAQKFVRKIDIPGEPSTVEVLPIVGLLTAGCAITLWCFRGAYLDAIISSILFGLSMFVVAAWNVRSPHPMMLLLGKSIVIGIIGVVASSDLLGHVKEYESAYDIFRKWSIGERILYSLVPGFSQVSYEILASMAYLEDVESAGVNSAIICAYPILVAFFFYWYLAEQFTCTQWSGLAMTVGGTIILGSMSGSTSDSGLLAVVWSLASMLMVAVCAITIRVSSLAGWSENMCMVSRCIAIGIGGMLMLTLELSRGSWLFDWDLLVWATLVATIDCLGIYAGCRAYSCPKVRTACISAILGSASLVNLALNIVLLGTVQPMLKYVSMGVIVLGVVLLAVVG